MKAGQERGFDALFTHVPSRARRRVPRSRVLALLFQAKPITAIHA